MSTYMHIRMQDELACFVGHPLKIDAIAFAHGRKHLKAQCFSKPRLQAGEASPHASGQLVVITSEFALN